MRENCENATMMAEIADKKAGKWDLEVVSNLFDLTQGCLQNSKKRRWKTNQVQSVISAFCSPVLWPFDSLTGKWIGESRCLSNPAFNLTFCFRFSVELCQFLFCLCYVVPLLCCSFGIPQPLKDFLHCQSSIPGCKHCSFLSGHNQSLLYILFGVHEWCGGRSGHQSIKWPHVRGRGDQMLNAPRDCRLFSAKSMCWLNKWQFGFSNLFPSMYVQRFLEVKVSGSGEQVLDGGLAVLYSWPVHLL